MHHPHLPSHPDHALARAALSARLQRDPLLRAEGRARGRPALHRGARALLAPRQHRRREVAGDPSGDHHPLPHGRRGARRGRHRARARCACRSASSIRTTSSTTSGARSTRRRRPDADSSSRAIPPTPTPAGGAFDPARPAVVLVHGAAFDHSVWQWQSRYLAHHGCTRARGRPSRPWPQPGRRRAATIGEMARWVAALLESAGLASARRSSATAWARWSRWRPRCATAATRHVAGARRHCGADGGGRAVPRRRARRLARRARHGGGVGPRAQRAARRRARCPASRCTARAARSTARARAGRAAKRTSHACHAYAPACPQRARARRCRRWWSRGRRDQMTPLKAGAAPRRGDPRRALRGARRRALDDERGAARAGRGPVARPLAADLARRAPGRAPQGTAQPRAVGADGQCAARARARRPGAGVLRPGAAARSRPRRCRIQPRRGAACAGPRPRSPGLLRSGRRVAPAASRGGGQPACRAGGPRPTRRSDPRPRGAPGAGRARCGHAGEPRARAPGAGGIPRRPRRLRGSAGACTRPPPRGLEPGAPRAAPGARAARLRALRGVLARPFARERGARLRAALVEGR